MDRIAELTHHFSQIESAIQHAEGAANRGVRLSASTRSV